MSFELVIATRVVKIV